MNLRTSDGTHRDYWFDSLSHFVGKGSLFPKYLRGTGSERKAIEAEVRDAIPANNADLNGVLLDLAAFGTLLSRYTGNEKLLIAAAAPTAEAAPRFVRFACQRSWPVPILLQQLREEITASRQHACSLSELNATLGGTASPLTTFMRFGIACSSAQHWGAAGPPSLLLVVDPHFIRFEYEASLYPDDFARQLLTHYMRLRSAMASNRGGSIMAFDLLSQEERSHLLIDFNGTDSACNPDATLHGLFEEQAARRPGAIATIFDGGRTTYGELNAKANRLAAFLDKEFGVRTGDRVAVIARRSSALIAALLGIMKCGAVYVPINPKHPRDLAAGMIADCGASALIVDSPNAAAAGSFAGPIFFLDIELDTLPAEVTRPETPVRSSDIAYAIYTSGSTGRPKAVAVEHGAVVNTIRWRNDYYAVDHSDVNLQIPSFAFDSSVVDIFGFLAAGATLVIPDEDLRLDPAYIGSLIEAHGITRMIATASYYNLLHSGLSFDNALRSVTVAGESTAPELAASHFRRLPTVRLVNEYGPTENAVCSTACDLDGLAATVPIGRPIAGVKVFVLDELANPVPIGVPGEIFLAGAGLARGYWNEPAMTAERFLPCPFLEPGARMYRTGDWACWRSDGMLEFMGRRDKQIKIRGFRIELGEIETLLRRHPHVADAAVLAKQAPSGDRYLAAYVASECDIPTAELTAFAAAGLPDYMRPAVFHVLTRLPINLNGKLDLRQLHEWNDFPQHPAPFDAASPFEHALLAVCRELLNRPELGLHDDLFSVGASSLKVMEIVTALRKNLDVAVELLDVYSYPTVRELAAQVSRGSTPTRNQEITRCMNASI